MGANKGARLLLDYFPSRDTCHINLPFVVAIHALVPSKSTHPSTNKLKHHSQHSGSFTPFRGKHEHFRLQQYLRRPGGAPRRRTGTPLPLTPSFLSLSLPTIPTMYCTAAVVATPTETNTVRSDCCPEYEKAPNSFHAVTHSSIHIPRFQWQQSHKLRANKFTEPVERNPS